MPQRLKVVAPQRRRRFGRRCATRPSTRRRPSPASPRCCNAVILAPRATWRAALSYQLARKLGDQELRAMSLRETCEEAYASDPGIIAAAEADLQAVFERDPACKGYVQPFLFFKGFLALQTHRVAHWLWEPGPRDDGLLPAEPHVGAVPGRHPSGRAHRQGRVLRPRHRHRHRRDGGDRRRRLDAAGRDPGRHRRRARRPPPEDRPRRAAGARAPR